MVLEVCAFNIQSCFVAQKAGANRIEFCADPLVGGATPSLGALQYVMEHISIPVFPMIRPRGGAYVFDDAELDIIRRDIMLCRDMGFKGIATGVQTTQKLIDTDNLRRFVDWAGPMQVTCHKVFDEVPDAAQALEAVIAAGCSRILTSGLEKTAMEGAVLIKDLIAQAGGRIVIMPGGGVRSSNIRDLVAATGATEYHSAALINKSVSLVADEAEARAIATALS